MNTDGDAKIDPMVFINYLRDDVAGPGRLATFMLHSGPEVEEMVTSVSFVHPEVIRAMVKPDLLNNSVYPIDMVMVPDGDQETNKILTSFLYGKADSAMIIPTAQTAIIRNVLSNLLGTPMSDLLQELGVDSAATLPAGAAVLTVQLDAGLPAETIVVQDWQEVEVQLETVEEVMQIELVEEEKEQIKRVEEKEQIKRVEEKEQIKKVEEKEQIKRVEENRPPSKITKSRTCHPQKMAESRTCHP